MLIKRLRPTAPRESLPPSLLLPSFQILLFVTVPRFPGSVPVSSSSAVSSDHMEGFVVRGPAYVFPPRWSFAGPLELPLSALSVYCSRVHAARLAFTLDA